MASTAPAKSGTIPNAYKFTFGGLAGMGATVFVQPLDLVKNRMQMANQGVASAAKKYTSAQMLAKIIKEEGFFGLYNGLSAGLLRQATYTTSRLGIYTFLFEKCSANDKSPSFFTKAALGMAAGGAAAYIGTPADLALIRMTSDGRLPPAERRNYKNAFDALYRVLTEEGVTTLWKGCVPTVIRAMVVNAAQLATYSQAKQGLLTTGYFSDNIGLHFVASMISGLATTIASMPVDIAKTRIQNSRIIDGKPEYRNALDVFSRVIKHEGIFALWKGFTPYYFRLGPHTVLTFIFLEQMNDAYYSYHGIERKAGL